MTEKSQTVIEFERARDSLKAAIAAMDLTGPYRATPYDGASMSKTTTEASIADAKRRLADIEAALAQLAAKG